MEVRVSGPFSDTQNSSTCLATDRAEGRADDRYAYEDGPAKEQRQNDEWNGGDGKN